MTEEMFDATKWQAVISTEENEQAQCEYCKTVCKAESVGLHIYCEKCKHYLWRKKDGK